MKTASVTDRSWPDERCDHCGIRRGSHTLAQYVECRRNQNEVQ